MKTILLIDDDQVNAQIVQFYLNKSGEFYTKWAKDAQEALQACENNVDLILLDIMLPDVDGVELCRRIREKIYCPIIFVSCIDDEQTMIHALETGGDDYLVKPFHCSMLLARIKANLRRVEMEKRREMKAIVRTDGFIINTNEHTLKVGETLYHLSSLEFGVLTYMMGHPFRSLSLDEIYEAVWGSRSYGDVRTVISHVYTLRKKLGDTQKSARFIRSVRGYGYCFYPDGHTEDEGQTE